MAPLCFEKRQTVNHLPSCAKLGLRAHSARSLETSMSAECAARICTTITVVDPTLSPLQRPDQWLVTFFEWHLVGSKRTSIDRLYNFGCRIKKPLEANLDFDHRVDTGESNIITLVNIGWVWSVARMRCQCYCYRYIDLAAGDKLS